MKIGCQHIVIRVTEIKSAREFYIDKLGLEVLEETASFFAAKAGNIRFSFFEGYEMQEIGEDAKTGVSVIFRVENLVDAIKEVSGKGVNLLGDIIDIPKFHKFQEIAEPFGNIIYLAEYAVEPV